MKKDPALWNGRGELTLFPAFSQFLCRYTAFVFLNFYLLSGKTRKMIGLEAPLFFFRSRERLCALAEFSEIVFRRVISSLAYYIFIFCHEDGFGLHALGAGGP